jgi:catechol 2,3-dioxygenase-like lactoylglutathione lyase family enzyme
MKIVGTHHIALKTTNFDAMRAFYGETLGLPLVGGFPGGNIVFFSLGDTTVELIRADGELAPPVLGFHHLAIEVEDTDAAYAELKGLGIVFHVEPKFAPADAPQARLAFFKDPDGNELELFQPIGGRYPQP